MAIATVTNGTAQTATNQTVECPAPASIIDDNYLRIIATASNDVNISVNESGWTTIAHVQMTAGSMDGTLAVFIKKASSESGTYTVDIDGGVNYALIVQCAQFSGIDLSIPSDKDPASTITDQSGTSIDPPAITTATDDAWVESVIYARGASISKPSMPAGYTEFGGRLQTNHYLGASYIDAGSAGVEDPGIWSSFGVSTGCCGITWAMRPAGGVGGDEEAALTGVSVSVGVGNLAPGLAGDLQQYTSSHKHKLLIG
jgi:hypothetical protein